jgi:hypothetical protein
VLGFSIRGERGEQLYDNDTRLLGTPMPPLRRGQPTEMRVWFVATLRDGSYTVLVGLVDSALTMFYDYAEILSFIVQGSTCLHGLVDLQARIDFRPGRDEIERTDEPHELRHKGEAR